LTEDALHAQDEAFLASLPKPKPLPVPTASVPETAKLKPPKLTKEEKALREKWTRLLEMVNKGRLDALKTFWDREGSNLGGINAPVPDWTDEKKATLLQVASATEHEDVIRWLLEEARADPTIDVPFRRPSDQDVEDGLQLPGSRRTAYDLAPTRAVRNVFRKCAAAHPDWWDWLGAARVTSALSHEMDEDQEEKKKVRRKLLKEKARERESRDKDKKPSSNVQVIELADQGKKPIEEPGPRKLGESGGRAASVAGLTPEMKARVEREQRARAAEARIKLLSR
jgi:hypothetical protein